MSNKLLLRGSGITPDFASTFKKSAFYMEVYTKHKDELILGVRNGYINLYYNCDSIGKISMRRDGIRAEIAEFYINGRHGTGKKVLLTADEVSRLYDTMIKYSDTEKSTPEKKAQHQLVVSNNANPSSNWFCFDVEYKKAYLNTEDRKGNFNGRFDIMVISKDYPHRIAFIELKYGSGAVGGTSGIRKHIQDFVSFNGVDKYGKSYFECFKEEAISILHAEMALGVDVPTSLQSISAADIVSIPEFYVLTVDNNSYNGQTTPKMKMDGYLFKDKRWGARRISSSVKTDGDVFDLIKNDASFHVTFLFSPKRLSSSGILGVTDILGDSSYDKEYI